MQALCLGYLPRGQTLYKMQTYLVENELGVALYDKSLVSTEPAMDTVRVTTLF